MLDGMVYFGYAAGFGLILFGIFCRSNTGVGKDPAAHGADSFANIPGVDYLGHVGSIYHRVSVDGRETVVALDPAVPRPLVLRQIEFIRARRAVEEFKS